jgi:hypothetical protein
MGRCGREAGSHQETRDEEQPADETCARADGGGEPDATEGVIEHEWVHDGAERGPRGDDGHGEGPPFLEVVRDDGDGGDVCCASAEAVADALGEEYLDFK